MAAWKTWSRSMHARPLLAAVAKLGFGYRPIEVLGYVPKVATPKPRRRKRQQLRPHKLIGDLPMGDGDPHVKRYRGLAEEQQAKLASDAPRVTFQQQSGRPWLLFTQLSLMLWAVGVLLLWANRQRRHGSAHALLLLPCLKRAAKVHIPK